MSGTLSNIQNSASSALNRHMEAMAKLQEQAATGSRINRASDDPSTAYRMLGLESETRYLANYMDNLEEIISTLQFSATVISGSGGPEGGGLMPSLADVKALITQVTGGIYSDSARKNTANAVNDILEQVVSLANTKHRDQYLFGGNNTDSPPYTVQRDSNGKIISVTYEGSLRNRQTEIAPGVDSSSYHVGDAIFKEHERGEPLFIGSTGAKAGMGTSNVTGTVWLTVAVEGATFKLSIDDGATWVTLPAGDKTNVAVTDANGRVLYVDGTDINAEGVEMVSTSGTHDIFNALITIRDVLATARDTSELQGEMLEHCAGVLDDLSHLLLQSSVSIGSRIGFLENMKENLGSIKFDTEDETDRLEEADIAEIAIDLSRHEVLYQMSLSITGKLLSINLLDFID
jgi:flagellar hook-associated protein 3